MKEKVLLLYSALRDERTPWYAKALCWIILAYIISPVDIIPDFIPVIGLLDEIILVPISLWIIFKLIPDTIKIDPATLINKHSEKNFYIYGIVFVVIIWTICLSTACNFIFSDLL